MPTNRQVYDEIAEGWYQFRHWSRFNIELQEMATRWQRGKLLNIGCAHGPDFLPFKNDFELWGVDFSSQMLRMAQKYAGKFNLQVKLVIADATFLPYPDDFFDCAIAVAVYHNIKGQRQIRTALGELRRVLKPGAEAFITVWNKWQPGFWLKGKEVNIPWKSRGKTYHRYYYLYSYPELRRLMSVTGFEIISISAEKSYKLPLQFFSRNICALIKK